MENKLLKVFIKKDGQDYKVIIEWLRMNVQNVAYYFGKLGLIKIQ
jgi:hypothetical protein